MIFRGPVSAQYTLSVSSAAPNTVMLSTFSSGSVSTAMLTADMRAVLASSCTALLASDSHSTDTACSNKGLVRFIEQHCAVACDAMKRKF
eukprot:16920-Heterococcus_DN1.PRE.2